MVIKKSRRSTSKFEEALANASIHQDENDVVIPDGFCPKMPVMDPGKPLKKRMEPFEKIVEKKVTWKRFTGGGALFSMALANPSMNAGLYWWSVPYRTVDIDDDPNINAPYPSWAGNFNGADGSIPYWKNDHLVRHLFTSQWIDGNKASIDFDGRNLPVITSYVQFDTIDPAVLDPLFSIIDPAVHGPIFLKGYRSTNRGRGYKYQTGFSHVVTEKLFDTAFTTYHDPKFAGLALNYFNYVIDHRTEFPGLFSKMLSIKDKNYAMIIVPDILGIPRAGPVKKKIPVKVNLLESKGMIRDFEANGTIDYENDWVNNVLWYLYATERAIHPGCHVLQEMIRHEEGKDPQETSVNFVKMARRERSDKCNKFVGKKMICHDVRSSTPGMKRCEMDMGEEIGVFSDVRAGNGITIAMVGPGVDLYTAGGGKKTMQCNAVQDSRKFTTGVSCSVLADERDA